MSATRRHSGSARRVHRVGGLALTSVLASGAVGCRTVMATPQAVAHPAPLAADALQPGQRVRVWVGNPKRPQWRIGFFRAWRGDSLAFERTDLLAARGAALVPRDSLVRLEVFHPVRGRNVGGACLAVGLTAGVLILVPTIISQADGQPEAELGYGLAVLGTVAGCAIGSTISLMASSGTDWQPVALPATGAR